jgi:hypothetical protein
MYDLCTHVCIHAQIHIHTQACTHALIYIKQENTHKNENHLCSGTTFTHTHKQTHTREGMNRTSHSKSAIIMTLAENGSVTRCRRIAVSATDAMKQTPSKERKKMPKTDPTTGISLRFRPIVSSAVNPTNMPKIALPDMITIL